MTLFSDISLDSLKGIGPKLFEKLNKLGLYTLQDILFFLPYKYQDRTHLLTIADLLPGQELLTQGRVTNTRLIYARQRMLVCQISDEAGQQLTLKFFHFNQQQHNSLTQGRLIRCFGEIRQGRQGLHMIHPEYRLINDSSAPVEESYTPVYPQVKGISQNIIRKLVVYALEQLKLDKQAIVDYLPEKILNHYHYPSLVDALFFLHQPEVESPFDALLEKNTASHKRLAFEELLAHQLSVKYQGVQAEKINSAFQASAKAKEISDFIKGLPFNLTSAQQRVLKEIHLDLTKIKPMSRLLQGDVGSGKTIIAAIILLYAIREGFQVAVMAPTELLAEQLFTNMQHWFKPYADKLTVQMAYLSAKVKGKLRQKVQQQILCGDAQLVIGTHALFQQEIIFKQLGLVIIDEQHRFGVHQRMMLRNKGKANSSPHLLVMTATPIPRTLAMTAYADLSCSIIDQLPPGRKVIKTIIIPQSRRQEMIDRIYLACQQGKQCYWICTLIEESEVLQCQAAEQTYADLLDQLTEVKIGLVHGRMKNDQKSQVMQQFKDDQIQLLIATTVVEVGVDVPNASLMIIENAERLGLSQLHQLRGRVGRGTEESVCALIYGQPISQQGKKRLKVIRETNDGFKIAEQDLKIRGPGEFLGTRQTGLAQMKIADLIKDQDLIPQASQSAQWLIDNDRKNINLLIKRWIGEKIIFKDA